MGIGYSKLNDNWKLIKSEKTGLLRGFDELDKQLHEDTQYLENGMIYLFKFILKQERALAFIKDILEDKLGCIVLIDGIKSYYTQDYETFYNQLMNGDSIIFYYRLPHQIVKKFISYTNEIPKIEILQKYY